MAQMLGKSIALLFHYRDTRRFSDQQHAPVEFTTGKEVVPFLEEAGCTSGRSGGAENLSPLELGPGHSRPG